MISLVLDAVIIIICAFIIIRALKNGLIKSAMGMIKGILSFIAAYAFTPVLGDIIYKNFALEKISEGIRKTIESLSATESGTFNLAKMVEDMPSALKQIIDRYGASQGELEKMCGGITDGGEKVVSDVADYIAQPVADMISSAVAFIIIFIGVFIALTLIAIVLDAVFHLPLLNSANKLLGLVFGVAEALIVAVFLSSVLAALFTALGSVDSSLFGEHVAENSYVVKFFSSVDLFGLIENVFKT